MSRKRLRRALAWCLTATILLPAVVALVAGLGRLLAALGDEAGAVVCDRLALVGGVFWAVAIAATTICNAALLNCTPAPAGSLRRRRRGAMRRWQRERRERRQRRRQWRRREERRGQALRRRGRRQGRGHDEGPSDPDAGR